VLRLTDVGYDLAPVMSLPTPYHLISQDYLPAYEYVEEYLRWLALRIALFRQSTMYGINGRPVDNTHPSIFITDLSVLQVHTIGAAIATCHEAFWPLAGYSVLGKPDVFEVDTYSAKLFLTAYTQLNTLQLDDFLTKGER
jgi:hypothetical protein